MRTETKRRIGRFARGVGAAAALAGLLGASWWLALLPVDSSLLRQGSGTQAEQPEAFIQQADRLLETLSKRRPSSQRTTPEQERRTQKEALRLYQSALGLFAESGDAGGEARAWKKIGAALFGMRQAEKAVEAHLRSAGKASQAGQAAAQVEALIEAGVVLSFLGRPHQAIELYEKALQEAVQSGQEEGRAEALGALADQLRWIGDMEKSLSVGEQALEIWRELGRRERGAWTLVEIGRTNSLAGRDDEALESFNEALQIHESTGDVEGQIDVLTEIGWTLHWMDRSAEAVKRLQRAIELSRQIGKLDAGAHDRLGTAYRKLGRFDEAREAYLTAMLLLDAGGERFLQAHVLANLAELRVARREPKAALGYCAQAKKLFQKLDDPNALAHTLYIETSAVRDLGRLEAAHELMLEVRAKLESQRGEFHRQGILDAFQSSRNLYLEFFVDLLMERSAAEPEGQYAAKALEAIEKVRARSLREALWRNRLLLLEKTDPELKTTEQNLRASFDALDRERVELLQSDENQDRIAQIEAEQQDLLDEFDQLYARFRETYAPLDKLSTPRSVTVTQIQEEILDDDTLLLTYSLGDRRSFLWAVGAGLFETYELLPRKQLEALVVECHSLLSNRPTLLNRGRLAHELGRLSEALIGPVRDLIEPGRRLVVVPDGKLQYVSFGTLPSSSKARQGTGAAYLIEDHEVVQLPSVSTLAALRKRPGGKASQACLAVWADAVFGPEDPRLGAYGAKARKAAAQPEDLQRSVELMGLQGLPRLRGSRREATEILKLVTEDQRLKFLDFEAAREPLINGRASHCQFLHLASHTLLNPLRPELSGIALSLLTAEGKPRPGFLRPHDVAHLNLSAEVVVLSACQTAAGKDIRGEGISGLPQSFMLAGVPRIVMSLWPVSDAATPELMTSFYKGMLQEGQSPAAALRSAQLSMIADDRWRDPYYWAGFVLLGEWRGIE